MAEIIRPIVKAWNDWCRPHRCPCLTCPYWINHNPKCACKPCDQPGLRSPKDVLCYRTSNGKYGKYDVFNPENGKPW